MLLKIWYYERGKFLIKFSIILILLPDYKIDDYVGMPYKKIFNIKESLREI